MGRSSSTHERRRFAAGTEIGAALDCDAVRACYQPLVDLTSGETVGFEALARGPQGSALERPDQLFEAARVAGLRAELDWACQRAALEGAIAAGLARGQALFVNLEPSVLDARRPAGLEDLVERALDRFPVFVELTERALADRPAELLRAVAQLRARGLGVALDDVGADPRSLALMPFLEPDVVKLDLRLVQDRPSPEIAEVVHAVNAQAERTGAIVLAEGIETEEHRDVALALGARYGQGWLFGRPGGLPRPAAAPGTPIAKIRAVGLDPQASPYEVASREREPRQGDKRLLLELSLHIEEQVARLGSAAVVLSSFQESRYFTRAAAARYARLAERAALVGALGVGLSENPAPEVRGVAVDRADPLRGEWSVTVIAPHFAIAFLARDRGDEAPDMSRRFDFVLTYERELVTRAAAALMGRLAAR